MAKRRKKSAHRRATPRKRRRARRNPLVMNGRRHKRRSSRRRRNSALVMNGRRHKARRRRNPLVMNGRRHHRRVRRNPGFGNIGATIKGFVPDMAGGAIAGVVNALAIEQLSAYLTGTTSPLSFLVGMKMAKPAIQAVAGLALGVVASKVAPLRKFAGGIVSGMTALAANNAAASLFATPAGTVSALVEHYGNLVAAGQVPQAEHYGALLPHQVQYDGYGMIEYPIPEEVVE